MVVKQFACLLRSLYQLPFCVVESVQNKASALQAMCRGNSADLVPLGSIVQVGHRGLLEGNKFAQTRLLHEILDFVLYHRYSERIARPTCDKLRDIRYERNRSSFVAVSS